MEVLVRFAPLPDPCLKDKLGSGWETPEDRIRRVDYAIDSFMPSSRYPIIAGERRVVIICPYIDPCTQLAFPTELARRMLKYWGEHPPYRDLCSEWSQQEYPLDNAIEELIQLFRVVLESYLPPEAKHHFTMFFGTPLLNMEDHEQIRDLLERANLSAANLFELYPKPC